MRLEKKYFSSKVPKGVAMYLAVVTRLMVDSCKPSSSATSRSTSGRTRKALHPAENTLGGALAPGQEGGNAPLVPRRRSDVVGLRHRQDVEAAVDDDDLAGLDGGFCFFDGVEMKLSIVVLVVARHWI